MTVGSSGVVQLTKDTYKGTQDALLSVQANGTLQKTNATLTPTGNLVTPQGSYIETTNFKGSYIDPPSGGTTDLTISGHTNILLQPTGQIQSTSPYRQDLPTWSNQLILNDTSDTTQGTAYGMIMIRGTNGGLSYLLGSPDGNHLYLSSYSQTNDVVLATQASYGQKRARLKADGDFDLEHGSLRLLADGQKVEFFHTDGRTGNIDVEGVTINSTSGSVGTKTFDNNGWSSNCSSISQKHSFEVAGTEKVYIDNTGLNTTNLTVTGDATGIPYDYVFSCSNETSVIDTTGQKISLRSTRSFTTTKIKLSLSSANSSGSFVVVLKKNGVAVQTIDMTTTAVVDTSDTTSYAENDIISVEVTNKASANKNSG